MNQCNCPLTQSERQIQFVDNLNKIHGNHSFKFGADLRYAKNLRVPSDSHRAGELYFNGNTRARGFRGRKPGDGVGLAAFLLGDMSSFDRYVSSSTNAQERQKRFFWYGQDRMARNAEAYRHLGRALGNGVSGKRECPGQRRDAGSVQWPDVRFRGGRRFIHGIQNMNWHEFAPRVGSHTRSTRRPSFVRAMAGRTIWEPSVLHSGTT